MLSNDEVLIQVFREDCFDTAKWSACGRDTIATIQLTDIHHHPARGPSGSSKKQSQDVFSRPLG